MNFANQAEYVNGTLNKFNFFSTYKVSIQIYFGDKCLIGEANFLKIPMEKILKASII